MNTPTRTHRLSAIAVLLIAPLVAAAAGADGSVSAPAPVPPRQAPAWQAPGYVMEEVVVTAQAPAAPAAMPAWQEPGFVMEEVVATAPAPAADTTPAWQEPGFVMEEVVVTARRTTATRISPRLRLLLALHERYASRRAEAGDERTNESDDGRLL